MDEPEKILGVGGHVFCGLCTWEGTGRDWLMHAAVDHGVQLQQIADAPVHDETGEDE